MFNLELSVTIGGHRGGRIGFAVGPPLVDGERMTYARIDRWGADVRLWRVRVYWYPEDGS